MTVKIVGNGRAAHKHAAAFAKLPELYQMTDSDQCDLIDICTPNHQHFKRARAAACKGQHVICEKPLCGSLAQVDQLIRIAPETGRICPIAQFRFTDHAYVGDGRIYTKWNRDQRYWASWYGDWNKALGGALISHGIHTIDLMLQHHGMPLMVSAGMNLTQGCETFADVMMGEPGAMMRNTTLIHPDIEQDGLYLGDAHRGFVTQFRNLHYALMHDAQLPVTLQDARNVLEVITAAYYSAFTGEPVILPLGEAHPFYDGWVEPIGILLAQQEQQSQSSQRKSEEPGGLTYQPKLDVSQSLPDPVKLP